MSSLHELTSDWQRLVEGMHDLELDDDAKAILDEMLADLEVTLSQKAQNIALVIDELNARAATIAGFAKQYQERAKRIERRAEWLRDYLLRAMQMTGLEKIDGDRARLAVVAGPPKVIVDESLDLDFVPDDLVKVERKLSLSAVKEALESGEKLAWARLERRPYLKVKL